MYNTERIQRELNQAIDNYLNDSAHAEEEAPFNINHQGGTNHTGETRLEKENPGDFFPHFHYKMRIDHLAGELNGISEYINQGLQPGEIQDLPYTNRFDIGDEHQDIDGEPDTLGDGSGELYMWRHRNGIPYNHVNDGLADAMFHTKDDAERAMQRWDEELDTDLSGSALYRVHVDGHHKVMEYSEAVTDQAGFDEYL